jgi:hypothetical protein
MSTKATITKRVGPCTCGCQGRDPQHQQTYERVLRNVVAEEGKANTDIGVRTYNQRATIKAPWSDEPVIVVHLIQSFEGSPKVYDLGWYVVKYGEITPK